MTKTRLPTPRRYTEDFATSRDLLRLAIPMMSDHDAALNPVTFAVWYEFCAGHNAGLQRAMREALGRGRLDDEATLQLYRDHIADADTRANHLLSTGLTKVLEEMLASARQAGTRTERFESVLQRWDAALRDDTLPDESLLSEMTASTREMQDSMRSLREQLDTARRETEQLRQTVEETRAAARNAQEKLQSLESHVEAVQTEATRDALTGLANRRVLYEEIKQCLANPDETGVVIFCDIDHFKALNDTHGHAFGDDVLRKVASVIASFACGPRDTSVRYGGEEFVVLMRGSTLEQGQRTAELIRDCIARAVITRRRSPEKLGRVTVSLGVAAREPAGDTEESWIDRADRAMYASKQAGRNRVTVAAG